MPENLPANASVMKDIQDSTEDRDRHRAASGRARSLGYRRTCGARRCGAIRSGLHAVPAPARLAERAWHRAAWEPAYRPGASYQYGDGKVNHGRAGVRLGEFRGEDARAVLRLEQRGSCTASRLRVARRRGTLEANSEFPGQLIEYRLGWWRVDALFGARTGRGKVSCEPAPTMAGAPAGWSGSRRLGR